MGLIDLLTFLFLLALGLIVGRTLWESFGFYYGLIGFFVGIATGLGFLDILHFVIGLIERWFPLRPICKVQKCVSSDYKWVYDEARGDVFQCNCGDTYLKSGKRFMQLTSEQGPIPYMKQNALNQWKPDISQ